MPEIEATELVWLVIVNNPLLSYRDKYKIFREQDIELAKEWATKNGFEDPFGCGLNKTIGMLNFYNCGEVSVSIILLPILEAKGR